MLVHIAQHHGIDFARALVLQLQQGHAPQLLAQAQAQTVAHFGHLPRVVKALRAPAQHMRGQPQRRQRPQPGQRLPPAGICRIACRTAGHTTWHIARFRQQRHKQRRHARQRQPLKRSRQPQPGDAAPQGRRMRPGAAHEPLPGQAQGRDGFGGRVHGFSDVHGVFPISNIFWLQALFNRIAIHRTLLKNRAGANHAGE